MDNKAKLFVETRKGRIKVDRLPTSVASRILGVWMSPNGDSTVEVEKLEEITKRWADRAQSCYIKIAMHSTIIRQQYKSLWSIPCLQQLFQRRTAEELNVQL